MGTVVIAVIEERDRQDIWKRAERDVYELGEIVPVIDCRDRPGEGLVVVPWLEADEAAAALDGIDEDWEDGLEIIDPGQARVEKLLAG